MSLEDPQFDKLLPAPVPQVVVDPCLTNAIVPFVTVPPTSRPTYQVSPGSLKVNTPGIVVVLTVPLTEPLPPAPQRSTANSSNLCDRVCAVC